jgi:hypothetical protein
LRALVALREGHGRGAIGPASIAPGKIVVSHRFPVKAYSELAQSRALANIAAGAAPSPYRAFIAYTLDPAKRGVVLMFNYDIDDKTMEDLAAYLLRTVP